MDGHVASALVVHPLALVRRPHQLLDAVPPADVCHQFNQGIVGGWLHGVWVRGIACHLDGDRPVVVGCTGCTPRAVFFFAVHPDSPVRADAVVAGRLPGGRCEYRADSLHGALSDHAVDGDGVDGVVAWAGFVGADFGVVHQWAVAHHSSSPFPSPPQIPARVSLSTTSPSSS